MAIRMKRTETRGIEPKEWLDQSGCFLFGKYEREYAEEIAKTDPQYIRWIVNDVDSIVESDREILGQYLTYAQRRR